MKKFASVFFPFVVSIPDPGAEGTERQKSPEVAGLYDERPGRKVVEEALAQAKRK